MCGSHSVNLITWRALDFELIRVGVEEVHQLETSPQTWR